MAISGNSIPVLGSLYQKLMRFLGFKKLSLKDAFNDANGRLILLGNNRDIRQSAIKFLFWNGRDSIILDSNIFRPLQEDIHSFIAQQTAPTLKPEYVKNEFTSGRLQLLLNLNRKENNDSLLIARLNELAAEAKSKLVIATPLTNRKCLSEFLENGFKQYHLDEPIHRIWWFLTGMILALIVCAAGYWVWTYAHYSAQKHFWGNDFLNNGGLIVTGSAPILRDWVPGLDPESAIIDVKIPDSYKSEFPGLFDDGRGTMDKTYVGRWDSEAKNWVSLSFRMMSDKPLDDRIDQNIKEIEPQSNLILIGGPIANSITKGKWQRFSEEIPYKFVEGGILDVGNKKIYTGAKLVMNNDGRANGFDTAILIKVKDPDNLKSIIIIAAYHGEAGATLAHALSNRRELEKINKALASSNAILIQCEVSNGIPREKINIIGG